MRKVCYERVQAAGPMLLARLLLLSLVLLLRFSASSAGPSRGADWEGSPSAFYEESAYVGSPTQELTPKNPKQKGAKSDFRLIHLSFSYAELMEVLCPRSADGAHTHDDEGHRRQLCSSTCGPYMPKFVADLAMDLIGDFPARGAGHGGEDGTKVEVEVEVTLSRGRWDTEQWGSAAALDVRPMKPGQSGAGADGDGGGGSRALGLHVPAGSTILTSSFQELRGAPRGSGSSNEPAFSRAESNMRAIHAKLSPALCTPTSMSAPVDVAAGTGHMSDLLGARAEEPLSVQRRPLLLVSRNKSIHSAQAGSKKGHSCEAEGDKWWYAVHNPAASLTGASVHSWIRLLLPSHMEGPQSPSRQVPAVAASSSPSLPLSSSNLFQEDTGDGDGDDDGKERHPLSPPSSTEEHTAHTARSSLAGTLLADKVAVGQAVSLAPWGSLHLRLSVHAENVTSANPTARMRKDVYRVHGELSFSLLLLPGKIKSHRDLLDAMELYGSFFPGAADAFPLAKSPGKSGDALQEQSAQAAGIPPHAAPANTAKCDSASIPHPVVHIHRTVRNLQSGYVMTKLVIEVGGSGTGTGNSTDAAAALADCSEGLRRNNQEGTPSNEEILVTVTEPVPSFLLPLLHTYRLSKVKHAQAGEHSAATTGTLWSVQRQGQGQEGAPAPTPADSEVILIAALPSFAANSNSLRWTQALKVNTTYSVELLHKVSAQSREHHPADASRGRDFPPAYVSLHTFSCGCGCGCGACPLSGLGPPGDVLLMVPSSLVRVPVPDFSMPFNVLTLGATAVAFLLGSLTNALFDPILSQSKTTELRVPVHQASGSAAVST